MTSTPKIHTYAAAEGGLFVNAYLIETNNGIVAVDATLTQSDSHAFRAMADAVGKPLLAVLITHAHPDHVAGITNLVGSGDVPVIATDAVARLMRATEEPKRAQWGPLFGDEWIPAWTHPNRIVQDGDMVTLDGVTFRIHDLGAGGDCDANAVWIVESGDQAAFVGDLVFSATHSYLADGQVLRWLANIEHMRPHLAGSLAIYAGHGPAGTVELLDRQRDYLLAYCGAVRGLALGAEGLTEATTQELVSRMERYLPQAPLTFMIALSGGAVAAELAG
jgi:glyoxylase-like metal-dependent hydrolase (beta-lactamase superfamily II)